MEPVLIDGKEFLDAVKSEKYIICNCGYKILVLPNLNLMARSIEAHVTEHSKMESFSIILNGDVARFEELLIEQLFNAMQHPQI